MAVRFTFAIALEDNESDDFCTGTTAVVLNGIQLPRAMLAASQSQYLRYDGTSLIVWLTGANRGDDLGDVPQLLVNRL